ncbi:DinB family protein [Luteipulveratus mongoliensis]|uniref:DinB-like protein, PF04978 family n=1 Tax=Luteipulveratus mongoliensis TaxID=571913 RepID=A0A0K1JG30_9MICO|nr:DinB family protein [Luteipulveratus mongoliensis]AKU15543.1 hypothetical protein VV02_06180 [Luteipulveratus mongoliensis]
MPAQAPMTSNEIEMLAGYVAQQLDGIKAAAYGLTDEQIRATPTTSALSIGGLIKHTTACATGWLDMAFAGPSTPPKPEGDLEAQAAAYGDDFKITDETAVGLIAALEQVITRVREEVPNLEASTPVPVPRDAPWFPKDLDAWDVRWVLLHIVEEVARHAGHADIIRESIDQATMYELLAGVEGWPETAWLKPWKPQTV